tara:strand:- start:68 stop:790 length:723 start_codon:yes stop_codon:yes gene_type:complete
MALTSTDQLHNQQLKIEQQKTEAAIQENNLLKQLMIGGKGGSPGQPYDDPEKGKGPFVPPPKSAGLRINPNTILLPKEPKEPETDEDYGEGEVGDGWKLSRANNIRGFQDKGYQLNIPLHDWKQIPSGIKNDPDFIRLHLRRMQAHGEGRGPQPKYHDEYNQQLNMPPWMQMFPDGKVREIPHIKEQYMKEHPELASASSRQIRDRLKPFTKGSGYDNTGGSLRGIPDSLRIQLLRDAKA